MTGQLARLVSSLALSSPFFRSITSFFFPGYPSLLIAVSALTRCGGAVPQTRRPFALRCPFSIPRPNAGLISVAFRSCPGAATFSRNLAQSPFLFTWSAFFGPFPFTTPPLFFLSGCRSRITRKGRMFSEPNWSQRVPLDEYSFPFLDHSSSLPSRLSASPS